jgi:RNA-binding protein NOB1
MATLKVEDESVLVEETVEVEGKVNVPPETTDATKDNNQDDNDGDDDDDGWITPSNISRIKQKHLGAAKKPVDEPVIPEVACITTDYAMQNVLLQMNLDLLTVDGMQVHQLKQWVQRCHACFLICKDMQKQFCPRCGGNTLTRVSVSIDPASGQMIVHLKKNFQHRLRGTVFTLPKPKTGREAGNLILREDQKEYQQGLKRAMHLKKKQEKLDVFDADFVHLGERKSMSSGMPVIGYGRRNPNEVRRGRR